MAASIAVTGQRRRVEHQNFGRQTSYMEGNPKRRWLRYSVRTLLVADTIFAVWPGWPSLNVAPQSARRLILPN